MHPSVTKICADFFGARRSEPRDLNHWYFSDNEKDANELAQLVLAGEKRATSPSLWWFEANGESIPAEGDLEVVTNWDGEAQCIVETTKVEIVPFNEISEEYAQTEGEGDKSLDYWRHVHWAYYQRELRDTDFDRVEDMPIVCMRFRVVFPATGNIGV